MLARQVSIVYCDDIRQEHNGKTMLIGCYENDMVLKKIPYTISKMYCYFNLRLSLDDSANDFSVALKLNDNEINTFESIPIDKSNAIKFDLCDLNEFSVFGVIAIKDLLVASSSIFKLCVIINQETIEGNCLRIIDLESLNK